MRGEFYVTGIAALTVLLTMQCIVLAEVIIIPVTKYVTAWWPLSRTYQKDIYLKAE
jgi:hypothetical protein